MLTVYNSLTRKKERVVPINPGQLSIYVCGMTVYDECHLGHARSMVCFDVIVRYLMNLGFDVTYVRNITDIDDKIIHRAAERGVSITELTTQYIQAMHRDAALLNTLPPTHEPRATDYIEAIIELIQTLIKTNYAYSTKDGDVYYQVDRFSEYGKLSRNNLEDLMAGSRVDVDENKHSPLDFVLWKQAKPGEPSWDSPWGPGRPGWHIECSAMANQLLGAQFDMHGGGLDLEFPHHENEIAQSEAVSGKPFVNYWLHVGMLQIDNEKMSKSTGNFLTITDTLARHHPEVVRFFLLSSHYRSPLNYTQDNLLNANKALTRLYQSIKDIECIDDTIDSEFKRQFDAAMSDDFNTPVALAVLFELSHELNKTKQPLLAQTLKQLASVLGLLADNPTEFLQGKFDESEIDEINRLVSERQQARKQGDWSKADAIRVQLTERGIEVEDSVEGSTWRRLSSGV